MLILALLALALLIGFAFVGSDWSDVLSPVRNDLVFAERNRAYGAYRLRREHHRVLGLSALIALGLASLVFTLPRLWYGPQEISRPPADRAIIVELKDFVVPSAVKPDLPVVKPKAASTGAKPNPSDLPPIAVDSAAAPVDTTARTKDLGPNLDTLGHAAKTPVLPPGGGGGSSPVKTKVTMGMNEAEFAPEYPGGLKAFYAYLGRTVRYPEIDREARRQGRVVLGFVVDEEGNVTEITVLSGVSRTLDAEAVRVVKRMGRWKPGRHRGEAVRVSYQLPISFRLSDQ
ncbi:MAG: TonB family protein [Flavobacteriales bacterium]|nr:TonB family protein [Flavobacteriales bacterium]